MAEREARIKCGHCKGRHTTIAQARVCGHRANAVKALQRAADADEAARVAADAQYLSYLNDEARAEAETERAYERWLEDGGAHSEIIAWENEQDRLREGLPFA